MVVGVVVGGVGLTALLVGGHGVELPTDATVEVREGLQIRLTPYPQSGREVGGAEGDRKVGGADRGGRGQREDGVRNGGWN